MGTTACCSDVLRTMNFLRPTEAGAELRRHHLRTYVEEQFCSKAYEVFGYKGVSVQEGSVAVDMERQSYLCTSKHTFYVVAGGVDLMLS